MNRRSEFIRSLRCAAADLLHCLSAGTSRTDMTIATRQLLPPLVPDQSGPRDTAIVVDVSASMGISDYPPTRLVGGIHAGIAYGDTRAKKCPGDRIAVISFSTVARLVLPLTPVTNRKMIIRALHRLTADGGTDIAEGLRAAADLFEHEPPARRRRHAISLTDGDGGQPLEIAAKLKDELGVVIDVVGIGGSPGVVNEVLLRQVATTDPDGFCHYHFIKDAQTLSEHYTQLAKGLLWRGGGK